MIKIKRIYDEPAKEDGLRILVSKFWPRELTKEEASVNLWLDAIAPSDDLWKWFSYDPKKWKSFKHKYFVELGKKLNLVDLIISEISKNTVTLVYGDGEQEFNSAEVVKEYIEARLARRR